MTAEAGDQSWRWARLLEELAVRQRLSVSEAADLLGVSAATVRRDFKELARQQLAARTHGGIVAASVAYDLPARYRVQADDPKQRIAAAAAALVRRGETIAFNGGTTVTAVARQLAMRADLARAGDDAVTVVTNALNIASDLVLRPHIRMVCVGGVARPESYELHGPFASRVLADLLVHHLFLGVDALSATAGASCRHLGESSVNAEMVGAAQRVTVVADASKLGAVQLSRICPISAVSALITDDSADPEQVAALRGAGVEVSLV